MTTIHDAYINALLADASYVNDFLPGMTGAKLTAQVTGRMTPDLAKYIGDNFTVVTQFGNGSMSDGFNATVWKDKSGKVYVSMRGTQELFDLSGDIDLAASGVAYSQLVDMVNWWLRESTATGPAIQIGLKKTDIPLTPFSIRDFVAAPSVASTGTLSNIGLIQSVNGHSLGGYLASAFMRIFGQTLPATAINTFNSAGFSRAALASGNIDNAFNQIAALIGPNLGLGGFSSAQNNYYAQNGLNFTTNNLDPIGFAQYGRRKTGVSSNIPTFQHSNIPTFQHFQITKNEKLGSVLTFQHFQITFPQRVLHGLPSCNAQKNMPRFRPWCRRQNWGHPLAPGSQEVERNTRKLSR